MATIKAILPTIGLLLALDVMGFMLWALSGQLPADSFYLGTITAHTLGAFLF